MACVRHLSEGHTWYLAKWDAIQNPLLSLALVIPHPALSWHLCLCFSAESAVLLVFPQKQLSNCLWSCCQPSLLRNQPWELLGSWLAVPLPGPRRALLPCAGPQGPEGTIFKTLLWHPGLQLLARQALPSQTKPSFKAAGRYQPLSLLTTQSHKWKNFCSKQPRLLYYLFIFFCNTPEHNLKLPLASTRLTVPFFLLGNIVYSDHPILLPLPGDLAERMLMK